MLYSRAVRKPKKSKKKRLGIVPRALLGAAIAGSVGSVASAVVPACSSETGPQFAVDANPGPDRPEFRVDAPLPDAAIDRLNGVEFAVDANSLPPDAPEFSVDAPTDA